jgi:hypothetical protein
MKFAKILIAIVVVIATLTVGIVYAFERVASYVTIASAETSYETPLNVGATEVFSVTNAAGYRQHTAPDLGTFEYPLAFYSVRSGNIAATFNGGQDVLFPGVISIEPNDSVIYGNQFDTAYRIQIAMVETDNELDTAMLGTGPLMQYDTSIYEVGDIVRLSLNGVPALRIDNLPIGAAGTVTSDIVAVHHGRLYEILVEPVHEVDGTAIEGRAIVDSIIGSLSFEQLH